MAKEAADGEAELERDRTNALASTLDDTQELDSRRALCLLRPFALGDVGQDRPAFVPGRRSDRLDANDHRRLRQGHLTGLALARKYPSQKGGKGGPVRQANELPQTPGQQARRFGTEELCGAGVELSYFPVRPQSEVTHRCDVVEIGVALQARLELGLGRRQVFVLQLQFDVVNFQLILEALLLGFGQRRLSGVTLLDLRHGCTAQSGGISWQVGFHITAGILRRLWSWRRSHKTRYISLILAAC